MPPFAPLLFPILIIPVMLLVSAKLSGWQRLANCYPRNAEQEGISLGRSSIRLNWARYRNSVMLSVTEEGLVMQQVALFRLGHAPICIPWSQLVFEKEEGGFYGKAQRFQIQGPEPMSLLLQDKVVQRMQEVLREVVVKGSPTFAEAS